MKFNITRQELLKAINIVEKSLSSKTVIDSLKGIKIIASKESLTFLTSKQDMAIQYRVTDKETFNVEVEGISILPGTHLITIVKKTETEMFEFIQVDNSTILKAKRSKINLIEFDKNSYPDISFEDIASNNINLNNSILHLAYTQNKYCTALNSVKPILTGLNFKFDVNELTVGATDARRLSISKFNITNNEIFSFTIATKILAIIVKISEILNMENIDLKINSNQIIVEMENVSLKARLIEGEYPNIERLIPENNNYSYELESKDILTILEKIQILSDRDSSNVTAEIINEELVLKSYFKELGEIEEISSIQNLNGSPFSIAFDPKFLIDAIHALEAENLKLEFVDEISAFAVLKTGDKQNIQVISPIRIS